MASILNFMHFCGFKGYCASKRLGGVGIFLLLLGLLPAMAQPQITKQPIDVTGVPLGGQAVFSVEAVGQGTLEFQWRLNGANLPGRTDPQLVFDKVTLPLCGTFTVAVTDDKGSTNSAPARLIPEIRQVLRANAYASRIVLDEKNNFNPLNGFFRADSTGATKELGEPDHAGRKGGASIWFSWIAPATGAVQFNSRGSGFDTLLAAYRGDGLTKLQPVSKTAADDDRGGFSTSEIKFNVLQGVEYAIAVDGYEGVSGIVILKWLFNGSGIQYPEIMVEPLSQVVGPGEPVRLNVGFEGGKPMWFRDGLPTGNIGNEFIINRVDEEFVGRYFVEITEQDTLDVQTVPAIIQINLTDDRPDTNSFAHDKFLMATDGKRGQDPKGVTSSAGPSRGYTTTQIFSTVGSTKDPGEPNHAGVAGGASEWYVYLAPESGTVHVNTDGSNYDTVLAVYRGAGFDYASLITVGSHNNSGVNGQDRVRFEATAGTTYFIAVDGVGGASGSVTLNVNLGSAPVITSVAQNLTVGAGTNATFTVTASGVPAVTYKWSFNGVTLAGATGSSYTRTGTLSAHAGTYSVVVANTINQVGRANTLTVVTPPAITTYPASQTVTTGSNVTFTVTASGSATLAYQWRWGGTNIASATTSSLTLPNVQPSSAGQYSVRITNSVGSATSSDATLTVNPPATPPSISSHPASQTVATGSNVTFTVTASGTATLAYQWRWGGTNIASATTSILTLPNVQPSQAGQYFVFITNSAGSATSSSATLTVLNPPAISAPPASQTVATGSNVTFTVTASGSATLAYQWRWGGTNIAAATTSSLTLPNVQPASAGLYSVRITNSVGSVTSSDATLTVLNPPAISAHPASQTVATGSNVTFTVTASGSATLAYQWRWGGTNIAAATTSSLTLPNVQPGSAGLYSVRITNSVGSITSSDAILTVLNPPAISAHPASQTVATGSNVTFTVTASGSATLAYQWRWGGTNIAAATTSSLTLTNVQTGHAGQYSVRITNSVSSVTSSNATLTVTVPSSGPVISVHPASQTVTPNANITLFVTATGNPAPGYQWQFKGNPLSGATASSLLITNFQAANEGSYLVTVSNSVSSVLSQLATLALNNPIRSDTFIRSTNGVFEINFIGLANVSYVLEGTTNFVQWAPIMTNSSSSGFVLLSDTNSAGFSGRFYRVVGP